MPSTLPFEVLPEVLNGIEVWRLCWPWQNLNVVVFEPLFGLFAGMLGVIVLLEDSVRGSFAKMTDAVHHVFVQNGCVEVSIHPAIHPAAIPDPCLCCAPSNHQQTPSKFERALHQSVCEALSWQFVGPLPPI